MQQLDRPIDKRRVSELAKATLAALLNIHQELRAINSQLERIRLHAGQPPPDQATKADRENAQPQQSKEQPRTRLGTIPVRPSAEINPRPSGDHPKQPRQYFWNWQQWKTRLGELSIEQRIEIMGLIVVAAYTTLTYLQLRETREATRFAERAAIEIGLSNGDLAEFVPDKGLLKIYIRNDGATAARQTNVDLFPVTISKGDIKKLEVPPFPGWGIEQEATGLTIPPGVTHKVYEDYGAASINALQAETPTSRFTDVSVS